MSKDNDTDEPSVTVTPQIHSPSFLVRENIEKQLFAIAKEHAEIASQDVDRSDIEKMRKEMKHSIIVIVMCYTALEALSNYLYKTLTDKDFDSNDYNSRFKNNEPKSRWNYLTRLAHQQEHRTDEVKSLPSDIIKDLNDLTELRRQIIHYKPIPESPQSLKRFPDNSPVNPELDTFTSSEAMKSIRTVRTLLETFEKITGYEVPEIE